MNVLVFCATDEDRSLYTKYENEHLAFSFTEEDLTYENISLVKGYTAIVILTRCVIDKKTAAELKKNGIKYIATRSAGFDHIDVAALKEYGIKAANVALYSPNAIAEYVAMVSLMCIRKAKKQLQMIKDRDFSLAGIRGKELRNMTVGIVGMGRIGFESLKIFSGFTKNILAYDLFEKNEVKEMATYVPLDELYQKSDLIVFHCPLTEENYHMISDDTIAEMKEGVILINPARGGLWDYAAILRAVERGKIAAVAFDVYEGEKQFLRKKDCDLTKIDTVLQSLMQMEQVVYTAHSAFYTDTAIENMIEITVENLTDFCITDTCKNEL